MRVFAIAAVACLALTAAACNKTEQEAVQEDAAEVQTDAGALAEKTGDALQAGAAEVKEGAQDVAAMAKEGASDLADKTKDAAADVKADMKDGEHK